MTIHQTKQGKRIRNFITSPGLGEPGKCCVRAKGQEQTSPAQAKPRFTRAWAHWINRKPKGCDWLGLACSREKVVRWERESRLDLADFEFAKVGTSRIGGFAFGLTLVSLSLPCMVLWFPSGFPCIHPPKTPQTKETTLREKKKKSKRNPRGGKPKPTERAGAHTHGSPRATSGSGKIHVKVQPKPDE